MTPENQVLHGPAPLRVTVRDPVGDLDQFRFTVRYNGLDVTRSFLRQCRISQKWSERSIVYENRVVRLPADGEHVIDFVYRSVSGEIGQARYAPPVCYPFRPRAVAHTGDFRPSPSIVRAIDSIAREEGFNPAFFTGLVAQESRFVPTAVSWAKALGLSQVTSSAEKEIAAQFAEWPRYPELERMPVELVRLLVRAGKINASNEWRLDPRRSIRGGVVFTRMLAERWSTPQQLERLRQLFADPEVEQAKLLLASYHSGYSRVLSALQARGTDWLRAPELQEARRYVNRVFSYCSFFEKPGETPSEEQNV
ncbi:MAG: transglycosylase SLT domain-containing protein [Oligoflexia bacterium]|nr:transglycosylase SLT domain-containing protein [Oligoflexia bacterium]